MACPVPLLLVSQLHLLPLQLQAQWGPSRCMRGYHVSCIVVCGPPGEDGERHDMSLAHLEGCSPIQMGEGSSRTIKVSGKLCFYRHWNQRHTGGAPGPGLVPLFLLTTLLPLCQGKC